MSLKMQNLTKRFSSARGTVMAVQNLNLIVEEGEFFVLLGPSGSGKSTILNLIAGLQEPTEGQIWFKDTLLACAKRKIFIVPKQRNVAMVFQDYALYPHMNVFENIAFPLKVAGMKREKIKESVEMAASMLKIEELLSAKPSELSGGQAQRVAIARALVRRPNIFLMDEPLSNLDAPLRASTRGEIKQLQRSMGVTTVYVTHDQAEAMSLGDRVAVLNEGKVQQVGKPKELYENPANPFVARFIGTVPMNLLKATLSGEGEQLFINVEKQKMKMPQRMREKVKKMRGRTLILGIRAEDIRIEDEGMRVKVLCVEELGKARLVRARLGRQNLSILFEGERVNEGESVNVKFCLDKACIFEEEC